MATVSIKDINGGEYFQVTNIRFLSMVTIIAMHTEFFQLSFSDNLMNVTIFQFLKFGTIGFFLISGFLLGHKLPEVKPWEYFKRRLYTTFRPWVFWAGLYTLIKLSFYDHITLKDIGWQIYHTTFLSNYWFVINFLFALGIILIFQKHFQSRWFFCFILLCSLFYAANLYFKWVSSNHTTAIFGYIFYIWVGIQVSVYRNKVIAFIESIRWRWFVLAVIISFLFTMAEGKFLVGRSLDCLSSLRLTNQIYSLVVFFALLKIHLPISPSWMNVRTQTYGIYLLHWPILETVKYFVTGAGAYLFSVSRLEFGDHGFFYIPSPFLRCCLWGGSFILVYFSSWFCTRIISQSRFSWLVGVAKKS